MIRNLNNVLSRALNSPQDTAYVAPFDGVSTSAAYSLRKLFSSYNGPAIRVRRASDSAERDIFFDPYGNLNLWQIYLFMNSSTDSIYVVNWYDQVSNRVIYQPTSSSQPALVSGGALQMKNGRPAIYFATNTYLWRPAGQFVYDQGQATVFAVASGTQATNQFMIAEGLTYTTASIYAPIIKDGTDGDTIARYNRNDAGGASNISGVKNGTITAWNNTLNVLTSVDTSTQFTQYVNGLVSSDEAYIRSGTCTLDSFSVGALVQSLIRFFFTGHVAEVIVTPTALYDTIVGGHTAANITRLNIEGSMKYYYGTP